MAHSLMAQRDTVTAIFGSTISTAVGHNIRPVYREKHATASRIARRISARVKIPLFAMTLAYFYEDIGEPVDITPQSFLLNRQFLVAGQVSKRCGRRR